MQKSFLFYLLCLIGNSGFSQAPQRMSYQAVIRDNNNQLVINQTVGMFVSILQGTVDGPVVYSETQYPTTNTNGLISIEVGGGNVVTGSFGNINWGNGPYFIKTETDLNGGVNYTITGTSQLLSVPYALYAENSGSSQPGPQGPPGPQGETGPAGPQGIAGPPGQNGSGGFTRQIGEYYGGGVIFHVWRDSSGVERGLIIDLNYLSMSYQWRNSASVLIGPQAQNMYDGSGNTAAIIAAPNHILSAAGLCANSTNGGYNDWYLPAPYELYQLGINLYSVNKTLSQIPGAALVDPWNNVWTSVEDILFYAYLYTISYPFLYTSTQKASYYPVRAIRAF